MSAEMKFPHYTTKQAGLHHRRLRTKGWDVAREMVEKARDVLAVKGAVLHRHVPVVIEREQQPALIKNAPSTRTGRFYSKQAIVLAKS